MSIPGYAYHSDDLPAPAISLEELTWMKESVLLGEDDIRALRRSAPILEPQIDEILDVWYGFIGSKPFLIEHFSDRQSGQPIPEYLDRVRGRFGQWIRDTAAAEFDEEWLRWQLEIARRHHRVGKNETDRVDSTPVVPLRYILLVAQPVVHTLRPFLEKDGDSREVVDAMHDAWRKAVLLQVTLWAYPYVRPSDF